MAERIWNDHNVYLLGAGYSKDAGLPLIPEFTMRMRDALVWLEREGRTQERDAIDQVMRFRRESASAAERVPLNLENIEELFSLAAASADEELNRNASLAIAATLDYSLTVTQAPTESAFLLQGTPVPETWRVTGPAAVGPKAGSSVVCPRYDLFALKIAGFPDERGTDRADTVITFNYDTLVEDGLHRLGIPFSYGFDSELPKFHESARCNRARASSRESAMSVHVIKLHGSVNWAWLGRSHGLQIFGTYDDVRVEGLSPMLTPPTWGKDPSLQLSEVWRDAVSALRSATRIVIVGYSMPPTDMHFKYLIAAGLGGNNSLRKICFVNPAADRLKDRLASVFRPDLNDGIVDAIPSDTRFLFKGGFLNQLNRASSPQWRWSA